MKLSIPARTELELDIYGQVFKITRPQQWQVEAVLDKLETANSKTAPEVWRGFLAELGLDAEFLRTLEQDHMMQVIDFVTGSKKK